jgi:hypothetical protein
MLRESLRGIGLCMMQVRQQATVFLPSAHVALNVLFIAIIQLERQKLSREPMGQRDCIFSRAIPSILQSSSAAFDQNLGDLENGSK